MHRPVLILGAGGQLGRALVEEFGPHHPVVETVHRSPQPGQRRVELADPLACSELLDQVQPEWILIAAAFCNVDLCETQQDLCRRVNALAPEILSRWASAHNAVVVYYSTDHVFDGTESLYAEDDPPHPLSVYASTKVEGEMAVRRILPDRHLILRTSGLYGPDPARKNFVIRLIDRLRTGETVPVASDQWGSPTATMDLALVTRFLLEKKSRGTFHATGPDFIARIDLARQVCRTFGLPEQRLIPRETAELRQAARRPLRVRLSRERLATTGAPALRSVTMGLEALRALKPFENPAHRVKLDSP